MQHWQSTGSSRLAGVAADQKRLCRRGDMNPHFYRNRPTRGGQGMVVAVLAAAILSGCGGGGYELDTAPVRGTVTVDGQPVTSGYVFVTPSQGRIAKGEIAEDGTFVLGTYTDDDGAQIGTHPAIVTPIPSFQEGGGPRTPSNIPARYGAASTSGLTITVEPKGENVVELALVSAKR